MAPATGQIIADLVAKRKPAIDISVFSPERKF
jgi:glycine/D-amino acid oxidase-like deaminating enzyme